MTSPARFAFTLAATAAATSAMAAGNIGVTRNTPDLQPFVGLTLRS